MSVTDLRFCVEKLKGKKQALLQQKEEIKSEINKTIEEKDIVDEAHYIVQLVAEKTQKRLEIGLSTLPSNALSYAYNEPYIFKIKFVPRRGKTEADLIFEKNGKEFIPGKRTGYGPVDLAILGLRLVIFKMRRPVLRPILLLDEPFPSIDIDVQERVCQLIKDLAEENNIQIIMITHNENLKRAGDRIFEIKQINGISHSEDN